MRERELYSRKEDANEDNNMNENIIETDQNLLNKISISLKYLWFGWRCRHKKSVICNI